MFSPTPFQWACIAINGICIPCAFGVLVKVWVNPFRFRDASFLRKCLFITGILCVILQIVNLEHHILIYMSHSSQMSEQEFYRVYMGSQFAFTSSFFSQYFFLTLGSIERFRHMHKSHLQTRRPSLGIICLIVCNVLFMVPAIITQTIRYLLDKTLIMVLVTIACMWVILCDILLDMAMIVLTLRNVSQHSHSQSHDSKGSSLWSALKWTLSGTRKQSSLNASCDLHGQARTANRLQRLKSRLFLWYILLLNIDSGLLVVYVLGNMVPSLDRFAGEFEQLTVSLAIFHIIVSISLIHMFKSGVLSDKSTAKKSHMSNGQKGSHLLARFSLKKSSHRENPIERPVTELSSISPSAAVLSDVMADHVVEEPMTESRLFRDDSDENIPKGRWLNKLRA